MSNTSSIVSIAVAWAGTAGGGVAMLRKYATKAENYISYVEAEINSILTKLEVLDKKLGQLAQAAPAPAPAPAQSKTTRAPKKSEKNPEPKKRLR